MKALVLGYDPDAMGLIKQFGYEVTYCHDLDKIFYDNLDLIVFLGGADIYPPLYGQEATARCYYDSKSIMRDYAEERVYHQAIARNIPCFGICRGFQFINVMNRGSMVQHVELHTANYGHHPVYDHTGEKMFMVNSYHHQQCVIGDTITHLLVAKKNHDSEVESAIWPKVACGGVQWHPEWMEDHEDARVYVGEMLCRLQNLRELRIDTL